MKRLNRRQRLIVAVVALQVLALVGTAVLHGARIADGTRVRIAVQPIDPLDLARGAYVDLDYGFEQLSIPDDAKPFQEVLVVLEAPDAESALWTPARVVTDSADLGDTDAWLRLHLGGDGDINTSAISTYYASSNRALDLERGLADDGGVAVVSIARDGSPTLLDVEPR